MTRPLRILALATATLLVLIASPAGAQDAKPTVAVTSVDTGSSMVTITNHGDDEVDPNGLIMCNFPDYAPIEGADTIAAGESITIESAVPIPADGAELGLYTAGEFENPDALVSYVEWGEPGHMRSPVAIEAGVWAEGVAEPTDGVITAAVSNPTSPADWTGATSAAEATEASESELALTGAETWVLALIGLGLIGVGAMTVHEGRRGART